MCQFKDICKDGHSCDREPVMMAFDDDGYMYGKFCSQYHENETRFDISHSGLSKYMERCEISNYNPISKEQEAAKQLVINYVKVMRSASSEEREIPWLMLTGHYGMGKTHLASAVFKEAIRAGIRAKPMYYCEDMQRLKNSYYSKNGYDDLMSEYKNVPFLFIDEFLKAFMNPDLPIITDIINYRYSNCLPTIITSEFSPAEIMNKYASIMDRIIEKTCRKYLYFFSEKSISYRQYALQGTANG